MRLSGSAIPRRLAADRARVGIGTIDRLIDREPARVQPIVNPLVR
jgi:hypothetical protein